MAITDPIADMLTRIRNASMAKFESVDVPFSGMKQRISQILKEEGYVKGVKVIEKQPQKIIRIYLKYENANKPVITNLKRVSKPGRRVYVKKDQIPKVLGGLGVAILSTPQGVMTDKGTRKAQLGGEVLCYIW
ncbi:MAG: 30S ribosomal protein S8 [bacterium]